MNFGEHQLVQRIKERFCMPEYATLANVATPSGTFADAVAVNLWRSRGYEVVGFEVKSTRSDWLREKKDPKKAEGCAAYCHTFWIVANEGVVKVEELPLGWGLMEPQGKGLIARVKAKPLEHRRELTVPFMVNLIRRAVEKGEMTEELNAAREAGRLAGIEEVKNRRSVGDEAQQLRKELERFQKMHAEFKQRTGIQITEWSGGQELAGAYNVAQEMTRIRSTLAFGRQNLSRAATDIANLLDKMTVGTNGA